MGLPIAEDVGLTPQPPAPQPAPRTATTGAPTTGTATTIVPWCNPRVVPQVQLTFFPWFMATPHCREVPWSVEAAPLRDLLGALYLLAGFLFLGYCFRVARNRGTLGQY